VVDQRGGLLGDIEGHAGLGWQFGPSLGDGAFELR
jgi:hypothetical protein